MQEKQVEKTRDDIISELVDDCVTWSKQDLIQWMIYLRFHYLSTLSDDELREEYNLMLKNKEEK
jgi:hypothetical protein